MSDISALSYHHRIMREYKTVRAMIRIYCRDQHSFEGELCAACEELMDYVTLRLEKCPYAEDKPTCANCLIHCYKADMQENIRQVMRFAGPRMIVEHPGMALLHLLDGRKKPPLHVRSWKR